VFAEEMVNACDRKRETLLAMGFTTSIRGSQYRAMQA
jgi:hypothetical protein